MIRAVVETWARPGTGPEVDIRTVDFEQLAPRGWALTCPTCGRMEFSVGVNDAGALVLSCWSEPTHIRLAMHQETEVRRDRLHSRYLAAIRRFVRNPP